MRKLHVSWTVLAGGQEGGRKGGSDVDAEFVTLSTPEDLASSVGAGIAQTLIEMEIATRPVVLDDDGRLALIGLHEDMRDDAEAFEMMGDIERCDLARGYAERIGGMLS